MSQLPEVRESRPAQESEGERAATFVTWCPLLLAVLQCCLLPSVETCWTYHQVLKCMLTHMHTVARKGHDMTVWSACWRRHFNVATH